MPLVVHDQHDQVQLLPHPEGLQKVLRTTTALAGLFRPCPTPMLTAVHMFPQVPTPQAGAGRPNRLDRHLPLAFPRRAGAYTRQC